MDHYKESQDLINTVYKGAGTEKRKNLLLEHQYWQEQLAHEVQLLLKPLQVKVLQHAS